MFYLRKTTECRLRLSYLINDVRRNSNDFRLRTAQNSLVHIYRTGTVDYSNLALHYVADYRYVFFKLVLKITPYIYGFGFIFFKILP